MPFVFLIDRGERIIIKCDMSVCTCVRRRNGAKDCSKGEKSWEGDVQDESGEIDARGEGRAQSKEMVLMTR